MPYKTGAVANYMLDLADADASPVTPMKLQKLLYFAHGWHLALTDGEPLLDDRIEAWPWGPVVPSVYHEFKDAGNSAIKRRFSEFQIMPAGGFKLAVPTLDECPGEVAAVKQLLQRVWRMYSPFTAIQLSNMTHETGSPWDQVWTPMNPKRKGTDIGDDLIQSYFKGLLSKGA